MKRLLFVHYTMNMGGGEKSLLALLNLLGNRYSVDLLLTAGGDLLKELPKHVSLLPIQYALGPYSDALLHRLEDSGHSEQAALRRDVRENGAKLLAAGVDAGHVHRIGWDRIKAMCPTYTGYDVAIAYSDGMALKIVAEKVEAKKRIAWIHCDYQSSEITKVDVAQYFKEMDSIVSVTNKVQDSFLFYFPQFAAKCLTVPNILPINQIRAQAEAFYPPEYHTMDPILFTCARLTQIKGIDKIPQTAKLLAEYGINAMWYIAGEESGGGTATYRAMAEQLNMSQRVVFLGNKLNPYPYMLNCDLYVQPSRSEGKPVSIEEAKCLGCSILTTRYAAVEDSIQHQHNGFVCGHSPREIAQAVRTLLSDVTFRKGLGQTAVQEYLGNEEQIKPYYTLLG